MTTMYGMFFDLLGLALFGVSVMLGVFTVIMVLLAYSYVISKGVTIKEKIVLVSALIFLSAWGGFLTYEAGHFGLFYLTTH